MKTTAARQLENASDAPRARRSPVSREQQTVKMRCLGSLPRHFSPPFSSVSGLQAHKGQGNGGQGRVGTGGPHGKAVPVPGASTRSRRWPRTAACLPYPLRGTFGIGSPANTIARCHPSSPRCYVIISTLPRREVGNSSSCQYLRRSQTPRCRRCRSIAATDRTA